MRIFSVGMVVVVMVVVTVVMMVVMVVACIQATLARAKTVAQRAVCDI